MLGIIVADSMKERQRRQFTMRNAVRGSYPSQEGGEACSCGLHVDSRRSGRAVKPRFISLVGKIEAKRVSMPVGYSP